MLGLEFLRAVTPFGSLQGALGFFDVDFEDGSAVFRLVQENTG